MKIFTAVAVLFVLFTLTTRASSEENPKMYLGGRISWIELEDDRLTDESSFGLGIFLNVPSSRDWFWRLAADVYNEMEFESSDMDLVMISLSSIYLFPLHGETWHPFLGLGLTYNFFDADSPIDIDNAFGWYSSVGLLWDIGRTTQLTAEFRYNQEAESDAHSDGVSIPDFDADGLAVFIGVSFGI